MDVGSTLANSNQASTVTVQSISLFPGQLPQAQLMNSLPTQISILLNVGWSQLIRNWEDRIKKFFEDHKGNFGGKAPTLEIVNYDPAMEW